MSEINTNDIELLAIEFRNRQAIKKTPRAKIFRDKLKEIENLLATDYSIKKFVEELNNYGYEITLGAFKYDLHRARQHLKSKTNDSIIVKPQNNTNQPAPQKADSTPLTNDTDNEEKQKPILPKRDLTIKEITARSNACQAEIHAIADKRPSKALLKFSTPEEREKLLSDYDKLVADIYKKYE